MKILIVHQYFRSSKDAGGTRHFEIARYLASKGHEVTALTSRISYLTGTQEEALPKEEFIDGIRVVRAWAYSKIHKSFIHRVFGFCTFMLSSLLKSFRLGKFDIIIGTSPPIFQGVTAWMISIFKWRPFVFEIRDLWPSFAIDMGILTNPVIILFAKWLERFLYWRADYFISLTPAFSKYLTKKGVSEDNIYLIPNGADTDQFSPGSKENAVRKELNLDGKFVLTYGGAHGPANSLGTILDCAKLTADKGDIVYLLVGDGKDKQNLLSRKQDENIDNVYFIEPQSKDKISDYYIASDVCIATLQKIEMFKTVYPNKLFDYMACERPTILAIDGEARKVLEDSGGGIYVEPDNPEKMAEAVKELYNNPEKRDGMGRKAREYVVKEFSRQIQNEKFLDMLNQITGTKENEN